MKVYLILRALGRLYLCLFSGILCYLAVSFIAWNINPAQWPPRVRLLFLIIGIPVVLVVWHTTAKEVG